MKCASLSVLFDHLHGRVAPEAKAALDEHISDGCRKCFENQNWLSEVLHLASDDASISFSDDVLRQVIELFPFETPETSKPLRQILAELLYDSMFPSRLAYVRLEGSDIGMDTGRQFMYHAEGYDIDLRVQQTEQQKEEKMIGQILPFSEQATGKSARYARLCRDGSEIMRAGINKQGIFRFSGIIPGKYDLLLEVPEGEILIPGLTA